MEVQKPRQGKDRSYRYVDVDMKEVPPKRQNLNIRYGDYVVHQAPGDGWSVGQYLGEHESTPEGKTRLRKMNALESKARTLEARNAVWRYEWTAQRGRPVVAPVTAQHNKKPSGKNTGRLTEAWVYVNPLHILCVVEISKGKIDATSWNTLRCMLDEEKVLSLHHIPYIPHIY